MPYSALHYDYRHLKLPVSEHKIDFDYKKLQPLVTCHIACGTELYLGGWWKLALNHSQTYCIEAKTKDKWRKFKIKTLCGELILLIETKRLDFIFVEAK